MANETTTEAALMNQIVIRDNGLWIPFPNLCVLTLPVWAGNNAPTPPPNV